MHAPAPTYRKSSLLTSMDQVSSLCPCSHALLTEFLIDLLVMVILGYDMAHVCLLSSNPWPLHIFQPPSTLFFWKGCCCPTLIMKPIGVNIAGGGEDQSNPGSLVLSWPIYFGEFFIETNMWAPPVITVNVFVHCIEVDICATWIWWVSRICHNHDQF